MPAILRELPLSGAEVIVVDNGSDDGTDEWLRSSWPQVRIERSREPLSFARAVNFGLSASQYSHVCLLNNDMLLDPGFFAALRRGFDAVPDLFCATAQIRFPEGVRREETGKAVMAQNTPEDFPLRCDEPITGENLTYVLYGSGGCSLYDAAKLRELGGLDQVYEPAYVEDLDAGHRAWQRGWPSVYVAAAAVEHRHRATTSRYYSPGELDAILEINYLKFLARCVYSTVTFRRLWEQAIRRLELRAHQAPARAALRQAPRIALSGGPVTPPQISEELFLALTNGSVFVFPGRVPSGKPRVIIGTSKVTCFPKPSEFDQVLVAFADMAAVAENVLNLYIEVVLVRRTESAADSFRAALRQTVRKWQPEVARLESGLMEYAVDCAPARTEPIAPNSAP